jgi:hypothetical protein
VNVAALKEREYWTPAEAAAVLGRGVSHWKRVFDAGQVAGYRDGGHEARYLCAESARAYCRDLVTAQVVTAPVTEVDRARAALDEFAAWRRSRKTTKTPCGRDAFNHKELKEHKEQVGGAGA